MTEQEFLIIMDEILGCEEAVSMDIVLEELEEWDSLSIVMLQAQMFDRLKKVMNPVELRSAKTIGDLYAIVKV